MNDERRKYQRIKIELPAQCTIQGPSRARSPDSGELDELAEGGPQTISFPTSVIDIAPGGVCFLTHDQITLGDLVEFEIEIGKEKIKMKAKVAWCDQSKGSEPGRAGVKITDIAKSDLDKLAQFYCQKLFHFLEDRKKILIIDDEKDMVDLLTYELKSKDYDVVSAYDGQAGFDKYLTEWPDLIILDVTLPKLNGYEVCRKIRREKNDTKTPIIMLTARDREADRIVGSVVGAEKYITKPFDAENLLNEIDKFLKAS